MSLSKRMILQGTLKNPIVHLFPIALILFASLETTARLGISVEGTIIDRKERVFPVSRLFVTYTLQSQENTVQTYVAGPNDHSLSRTLKIGDYLKKEAGQLAYYVNGKKMTDFPIGFYGINFCLGTIGFILSSFYWIKKIRGVAQLG